MNQSRSIFLIGLQEKCKGTFGIMALQYFRSRPEDHPSHSKVNILFRAGRARSNAQTLSFFNASSISVPFR